MIQAVAMSAALALFSDINKERSAQGLQPLVLDARLANVAGQHAHDMAKHEYFAHESQNGESPFDRMREAGCDYRFAGENIAMAPDERVADRALYASVHHRDNTLSPKFSRVGVGVAEGAHGEVYFVEDFSG